MSSSKFGLYNLASTSDLHIRLNEITFQFFVENAKRPSLDGSVELCFFKDAKIDAVSRQVAFAIPYSPEIEFNLVDKRLQRTDHAVARQVFHDLSDTGSADL